MLHSRTMLGPVFSLKTPIEILSEIPRIASLSIAIDGRYQSLPEQLVVNSERTLELDFSRRQNRLTKTLRQRQSSHRIWKRRCKLVRVDRVEE